MTDEHNNLVLMGKIGSPYGIKGWVKVWSYTEPMENLLEYSPWFLRRDSNIEQVKPGAAKRHGKGLIAQLPGVESPEKARQYLEAEILVAAEQMPALAKDEYYWHQLIGLQVYAATEGSVDVMLGTVSEMMATGANDVIVVCEESSGSTVERLIPWLPDQVILDVDLVEKRIRVDWDPDF